MDKASKFWLGFYAIFGVAITAMVTVSVSTGYWKDYNTKIVKLVESGVSPVAATCAMQDDYGTMPVCLVLAAKQQ